MQPVSSLAIGGLVASELELTAAELAEAHARYQLPDVGRVARGRQGTAVRLAALAEMAGAESSARFVHVQSADGSFTANVPIDLAVKSGLILYALEGAALPARFGGPFRLLFPDSEDCSVSVKCLGRLDFVDEPGTHTARCAD